MKRIILIIIVFLVAALSFFIGRYTGINHAISNSIISCEKNEVLINLDNNQYIHLLE